MLYDRLREILGVFPRLYSKTINFFTEKQCPICGDENVQRRSRSGFFQEKVFPLIALEPFRCVKCRGRFLLFDLEKQVQVDTRKKQIKRKKRKQQKEEFPQFFESADDQEFEKLLGEIGESERSVFGEIEKDETDPPVDPMIR